MKIYITPGTNLARDVYEIFLKCGLFTNQVIHLCEILKALMLLVDSYYYYLSQLLLLLIACYAPGAPVVPARLGPSCQELQQTGLGQIWGSFP